VLRAYTRTKWGSLTGLCCLPHPSVKISVLFDSVCRWGYVHCRDICCHSCSFHVKNPHANNFYYFYFLTLARSRSVCNFAFKVWRAVKVGWFSMYFITPIFIWWLVVLLCFSHFKYYLFCVAFFSGIFSRTLEAYILFHNLDLFCHLLKFSH